ncbi:hypothetical protein HPB51_026324 [Rhipicephalus microplus]|uniref:Uncharacterized protein n=1 Tax=Rhipicephalus microplus TaxID=6941 RepID=A0A9J6D3C7_RHIMP|nr:hypothetical protein HPB51_026324 [Rhipicephalus microplus]
MLLYPSFHRTIRRANETDTSLDWRCPGRRATVIYRRGSVLYLNTSHLVSYYGSAAAKDVVCTYHEKKKVVTRKRRIRGERPVNVLVLGIDSTSRLNFDCHMKRTRKLLTEELFAFEFLGYNKVGESSFGNQIPLLTGLAGDDVEGLFRNLTIDKLPHLWSIYKKRGYATLFLDEMPSFGLFVYRDYQGFREPPTVYYPVLVMHAMEVHKGLDYFGAGSRLKTKRELALPEFPAGSPDASKILPGMSVTVRSKCSKWGFITGICPTAVLPMECESLDNPDETEALSSRSSGSICCLGFE